VPNDAISPTGNAHSPAEEAGPTSSPAAPNSFSLATLMQVVTLVCLLCGLIASAPRIGGPLVYFLTPILVRTVIVLRHRRHSTVTLGSRVAAFAQSVFVVFFIALVSGVLLATCVMVTFPLGGGILAIVGVDTNKFGSFILVGTCLISWLVVTRLTYMLTVQLLGLASTSEVVAIERCAIAAVCTVYVALPIVFAYMLTQY
jgi:hypothetical protein